MANPHKGEVSFKAGDDEYTLSFSANALCDLEDALDMEVEDIIKMFTSGQPVRLAKLRIVFWQGLRDHHDGTTLDDAKKVLKQLRPEEMGVLIGRAFAASMPAAEGGAEAPPQMPDESRVGTGPASSTPGATQGAAKPNSGG